MKKTILLITYLLIGNIVYSQIGINNNDPKTTLDIRGANHIEISPGSLVSTDGILVPRVTDLNVDGVRTSQLVYLTVDSGVFSKGFHYWDDIDYVWKPIVNEAYGHIEEVTEHGNTGYRLKNVDLSTYGYIGDKAIDLGQNIGSSIYGATGLQSFVVGRNNRANSGFSMALGTTSTAQGYSSTTIGHGLYSNTYGEIVIGLYNTDVLGDQYNYIDTDRLFVIGNGEFGSRSDALSVLKNGLISAPTLTTTLIDGGPDKTLVTKEWVIANGGGAGGELEKITEGASTGYRLKGYNPVNYGGIGNDAVDLSISTSASTTKGATDVRSFAAGSNTQASGGWSTAFGTTTKAAGTSSTAFGRHNSAESFGETSLGLYSTEISGSPYSYVSTDRLFVLGNGTGTSDRSDALSILKNGLITAPSLSLSMIDAGDDKTLTTKEWVLTNGTGGELEKITEGGSTGYRIQGRDPSKYGDIGTESIDLSFSNGTSNTNGATGVYSFAAGAGAVASGSHSFAVGSFAKANGNGSVSFSGSNTANGYNSVVFGLSNTAESQGETAIGMYSTNQSGSLSSFYGTDRLFVIGNGTSNNNRSDALSILKNGVITAPSLDTASISNGDAKTLTTKEWVESKIAVLPGTNYGLEKFTEGGSTGYRRKGFNSNNYGDIGTQAMDLSYSFSASSTRGATGNYSFASGGNTTAAGNYSSVFGYNSIGDGYYSTSFGTNNTTESYAQTSMGSYATTSTGDKYYFNSSDRLFVIGNGTNSNNRSDAFSILKNGLITAPSLSMTSITNGDNRTLTTKEWVVANAKESELEKITEGGNTGYRLKDANPAFYGNIGQNAVDFSISSNGIGSTGAIGENSFAIGQKTKASGKNSMAMGKESTASGIRSLAMGEENTASGNSSVAIGDFNTASANNTLAMGSYCIANGFSSIALGHSSTAEEGYSFTAGAYHNSNGVSSTTLGRSNTAESWGQTSIGTYSTNQSGNSSSFKPEDRLFVIGNGTEAAFRSDALVMLKNGNTETFGIWTGPGFVPNSDRRFKKNITPLKAGMAILDDIKTYKYNYIKGDTTITHYGVIAQELQDILPHLVYENPNGEKMLSVNYTEMIPILINALKEQKDLNAELQINNHTQDQKLDELESKLDIILSQLSKDEKIVTTD